MKFISINIAFYIIASNLIFDGCFLIELEIRLVMYKSRKYLSHFDL